MRLFRGGLQCALGHQLPLSRCPYYCVLSRLRRTGCRRPTCTYVPIGIEPLLVNRSALPGFLVSSRQSRPAPRAAWPPSDLLPGAAPACPGSFELDQGLVHRCALLRENGPALELLHRRIFATGLRFRRSRLKSPSPGSRGAVSTSRRLASSTRSSLLAAPSRSRSVSRRVLVC